MQLVRVCHVRGKGWRIVSAMALFSFIGLALGCGTEGSSPPAAKQPPKQTRTVSKPSPAPKSTIAPEGPEDDNAIATTTTPPPKPDASRSLADLLTEDDGSEDDTTTVMPPAIKPTAPARAQQPPIDDAKAAAAGIRKLAGKHLTLYTDVVPSPEVDELPDVFDAAVIEWCEYFEIDPQQAADWHMTGFLIHQKLRFQGADMLPADLPPFQNGFQRGHNLWLYEQQDAYYRRHLLLHEGTHAFMDLMVGGIGPPWYAEGMAELLGTHQWNDGKLTLAYMPRAKTETPGWGRIKIVKDELAAGRGKMPENIMDYDSRAHLRNAPYGWCWAMAAFFDAHPRHQPHFRGLWKRIRTDDITQWFRQRLQYDRSDWREEWQVYVMNIEYGYDIARSAIVRKPAQPLPAGGTTVQILADRGWQSTGVRLEAGTKYRIEATGRYRVAETTEIWWCEPGGVTIHYYQGRPLGMLLGAVRDDQQPLSGLTPLVKPEPIGLGRELTPKSAGTLYLKINESAAHLDDNRGEITITIR